MEDIQKEHVPVDGDSVPKKKKEPAAKKKEELPTVTLDEVDVAGPDEDVPVSKMTDAEEEKATQIEELTSRMEEVNQIPKPLSRHARGWMEWLAYQQLTPEEFLVKHPTSKMRHFIEEIIAYNAQK